MKTLYKVQVNDSVIAETYIPDLMRVMLVNRCVLNTIERYNAETDTIEQTVTVLDPDAKLRCSCGSVQPLRNMRYCGIQKGKADLGTDFASFTCTKCKSTRNYPIN